jgi:hypothetical protein
MGKKNVHKLSPEAEQTFILLGISSHENDYRISWALNEYLGFHFTKTTNHQVLNQRIKEQQEFSTYLYSEQDESITYRLISNRCDNGFLLEELKNIDFLLLIEGNETTSTTLPNLTAKIKSIPFISAVFAIDWKLLKSKKNLF